MQVSSQARRFARYQKSPVHAEGASPAITTTPSRKSASSSYMEDAVGTRTTSAPPRSANLPVDSTLMKAKVTCASKTCALIEFTLRSIWSGRKSFLEYSVSIATQRDKSNRLCAVQIRCYHLFGLPTTPGQLAQHVEERSIFGLSQPLIFHSLWVVKWCASTIFPMQFFLVLIT